MARPRLISTLKYVASFLSTVELGRYVSGSRYGTALYGTDIYGGTSTSISQVLPNISTFLILGSTVPKISTLEV